MNKWDILYLDFNYSVLDICSTNPGEINILVEKIIEEGTKYFSYVNIAGKHKLEINRIPWLETVKHHSMRILFKPSAESYDEDKINIIDLKYFVLNIVINNDWLPYPGDGTGTRYIKYHE